MVSVFMYLAILDILCKLNYIPCDRLCLVPFTEHNIFEIHL